MSMSNNLGPHSAFLPSVVLCVLTLVVRSLRPKAPARTSKFAAPTFYHKFVRLETFGRVQEEGTSALLTFNVMTFPLIAHLQRIVPVTP